MARDDGRHPDAERLAEYADGVLEVEARTDVERHLADCAECRAVVAETMAFTQTETAALDATAVKVIPFRSRRWLTGVAAGLAVAAALVLAARVARPVWLFGPPSDRPELQELIAALANEPTRPVEGRLSGGFKYAPPPSPTRGAAGREVSPDVRIAAAKIEKLAHQEDTPEHQAAIGTARLALGDFDKAVQAFENAAPHLGRDARFESDLAAAYLARAKWLGRADDIPRALAAAGRAIALDPRLVEPHFNRALALEELHLNAEAVRAFERYRTLDPASPWSSEAQRHVERLKNGPADRSSASLNLQEDRERVEDEQLPRWGRLLLSNERAAADVELSAIAAAGEALAAAGGDTMVRDEVASIRAAIAAQATSKVGALARGHVLYGDARQAFLNDNLRAAAETFSAASDQFLVGASPYAAWGAVYRAIGLWVGGSGDAALAELAAHPAARIPPSYFHLRGRVEWTRAMAFEALGRWDVARTHLRVAVDIFQQARELEYLTVNQTYLASAEWLMGDKRSAWTHEINALEHFSQIRPSVRRDATLRDGGIFSLDDGLPEAALPFQDTLVSGLDKSGALTGSLNIGMAFLRRAEIRAQLGRFTDSIADLERAERELTTVGDANLRAWMSAELARVRARALYASNPAGALPKIDASLTFYRRTMSGTRLSELLLLRARTLEALNDAAGAEREFLASVEAFEHDRSRLSPLDRIQAFRQQREAFRELVRFEAVVLKDDGKALEMAERGRRGTLAIGTDRSAPAPDLSDLVNRLPRDVAVICYTVLNDRVMVWVLTTGARSYFERPIGLQALTETVNRINRSIEQNADVSDLRGYAEGLFRDVISPALSIANHKATLVFIPDGPLASIPFAAIPDAAGRPLLMSYVITVAPSVAAWVTASNRLTRFSPSSVLAVGDGHDPGDGLPRLPFADREAEAVGKLYRKATVLTGAAAAKSLFVTAHDAVIHFAGHTVVNADLPLFSRLVFAPDRTTGAAGTLLASELRTVRLDRTGVVVLATCNGAAGSVVDGEGIVNVARMFLDAGVPFVVGSLWPIDDADDDLMLDFHRALVAGHAPASALRFAQLKSLRERGVRTPIRQWSAYVAFGGVGRSDPD